MKILYIIADLVPMLPAILALAYWGKLERVQQQLGILLVIVAAISLLSGVLGEAMGINNMPLFHVYIIIETIGLTAIFHSLSGHFQRKLSWFIFSLAFLLAWLVNLIWGKGILANPSLLRALEGIVLISYAASWLLKELKVGKHLFPLRRFEFWLCAGIFIYFSGNLLLFGFAHYVEEQNQLVYDLIWASHAALVILLYIHYSIAFLWATKTSKSS